MSLQTTEKKDGAAVALLVAQTPPHTGEAERSPEALPHRKSGRGMSLRRRIGLKIEADESEKPGGTSASETETQQHPSSADDARGDEGEEWWKVEYRAPPPGHLGAHAIAREEGQSTAPPVPVIERDGSRTTTPGATSERPHLHETPERAKNIRSGCELYDGATSHSSPNPKRKIMDLQDLEAGTFPSMGVAKELKRFHETSEDHEGESEMARTLRTAVVTPSKLLRPMKKIDIQAGSALPATTAQPLEKPSTTVCTNATESA